MENARSECSSVGATSIENRSDTGAEPVTLRGGRHSRARRRSSRNWSVGAVARVALCGISAALMIGFVWLPAMAAAPADLGKSAIGWVAPDAVLCLEVPHPDRLLDRLTDPRILDYASSLSQYRNAIQSKNFREFSSIVKVIAAQLDTTWDEGLKSLTGGGIVLAGEAEKAAEPRIIMIVTPKDEALLDRANQAVLKLARGDAASKGKPDPIKTADHKGVTIYSGGDGSVPGYAIVRGRLVIANSVKNLTAVIERVSSSGAT